MATGSTNHNLVRERAIPKGSSKTIRLCIVDKNNAVVDISGITGAWSMVRENLSDEVPVISKALASGITIFDGPNGLLDLDWGPTDTDRSDGQHCWDVLIELASGKRVFVVKPGALVEFATASTRGV